MPSLPSQTQAHPGVPQRRSGEGRLPEVPGMPLSFLDPRQRAALERQLRFLRPTVNESDPPAGSQQVAERK